MLLDALAPPEGYELDQAVGTTFTLDLVALLRVPLAATTLPWSEGDGEPVSNPFALLAALRRHADRISLFCHAGAIKVPAGLQPLFTLLEGCVNQVVAPRGGFFHPKLWLMRFKEREGAAVAYRLIVLSRNLTFDRCWDIALVLDGDLIDRRNAFALNHPLADLVAALPGMAEAAHVPVNEATAARVDLLAAEVRRVRWENPEDFELLKFHPMGHDGRVRWPFPYLHRLLVVSPFVGEGSLSTLGELPYAGSTLVARFEELLKLPPHVYKAFDEVFAFDDGQGLLDAGNPVGNDAVKELAGLHAKLFLGEADRRARLWVGSANATEAALGSPTKPGTNVELLVELSGVRSRHGVQATSDGLVNAGLLRKFVAPTEPTVDPVDEEMQRDLQHLATRLASGALKAVVLTDGDNSHRIEVRATDHPVELSPDIELQVRPITVQPLRTAELDRDPIVVFPAIAPINVTSFFEFALTIRRDERRKQHNFVATLALEGAPEGRGEAVMADLLSSPDRLIAFLLLLLATDGASSETALDRLEQIAAGPSPGSNNSASVGLPLLEPMLRALDRDPGRLDEFARVISDLSEDESAASRLPEGLTKLWAIVDAVRRS